MNSTTTSIEINKHLFLNIVRGNKRTATTPPPRPVHHVFCIDCSGSMASDLPLLKRHITEKLPSLLGEQDALSLVWFSGKGQAGTVFEGQTVSNLAELAKINKLVDRWLKPIGLTAFAEPLVECSRIAVDNTVDRRASLIFMTDGHNNDCSKADVLAQARTAGTVYDACAIVEYGYYADRVLLAQMAEEMKATYMFADQFSNYEPSVEGLVTKAEAACRPRVRLELPHDIEAIDGKIIALDCNGIASLIREDHSVDIPDTASEVYFLSTMPSDHANQRSLDLGDNAAVAGLYAMMSIFARAARPKVIRAILSALGDVRFTSMFSGCFGKQKYTEFMQTAEDAAYSESSRMVDGHKPGIEPNKHAMTIIDMLEELESKGARLLLDDESFSYSRISRKREDASDEALKLTYKKNNDGYSVLDLTWNENRPNVSVLVRREATLDLKGRIPKPFVGKIPEEFPTHVFRNYSIVRDGMINISKLPVMADSVLKLVNVSPRMVINLDGMPVVNDAMVDAVNASSLFSLYHQLQIARARQKVLKSLREQHAVGGAMPLDLVALYGKDGAEWLTSIGVGKNGYAPPSTKQVEAKDFYVGLELEVKLKGWMTLPSVADVAKKIPASGVGKVMHDCLINFSKTVQAMDAKQGRIWLDASTTVAIAETRNLIRRIARIKYATILGQVWLPGFEYGEAKATMKFDGVDVACEAKLVEVEIPI